MIQIQLARFPNDLHEVISIFREYIVSPTVSLAFQNYEQELADLPGKYAPPQGRLLLAWQDNKVVGCAAIRKIDDTTCEMKRVYLRPHAREKGYGRLIVEQLLREARTAGYARVCLDVLPEFHVARSIYASLGFLPAPAVAHNPVPGTQFLALNL